MILALYGGMSFASLYRKRSSKTGSDAFAINEHMALERITERVTPEKVMICFHQGLSGDSSLFASIHRGRLKYNAVKKRWYRLRGGQWVMESVRHHVDLVEDVALAYSIVAEDLSRQRGNMFRKLEEEKFCRFGKLEDQLTERAYNLRSMGGALRCIRVSEKHLAEIGGDKCRNYYFNRLKEM